MSVSASWFQAVMLPRVSVLDSKLLLEGLFGCGRESILQAGRLDPSSSSRTILGLPSKAMVSQACLAPSTLPNKTTTIPTSREPRLGLAYGGALDEVL